MQRIVKHIYCAAIAIVVVSCNAVLDDSLVNDTPIAIPETISAFTPAFNAETRSFQGSGLYLCEPESWDGTETVSTRTYAVVDQATIDPSTGEAGEYYQYWSEGDAISLFLTRANLKYVMSCYRDGILDIGQFYLEGEKSEGTAIKTEYYYSVYPYKESTTISQSGNITYNFPYTQHYSGDTYANGENGMIAIEPKEGTDSTLYFQNFCSYLQLRLASAEGDEALTVKKITLTANDPTVHISGDGTVKVINEESVPVVEMSSEPVVEMKRSASNQIVLDCGTGVELSRDKDNPTKFWFVVPAASTFSSGFTVSVIFDNYSYYNKSTQKTIGIERSHIKPMATIEPEPVQAQGPVRYKYHDTSISESFPLNNTFYGEGGVKLEIIDQIYDEETEEWVVLLSGTLRAIGDNSFKEQGPDIEYIKICNDENPVTLNKYAFYNCSADSLMVYNPVDEICESAFSASTIADINIYNDVNSIKTGAANGSSLENLSIKGDANLIEDQAFLVCTTLETVDIDGNVSSIGALAFSGCTNLQKVNIGYVESIGNGAFQQCTSLTKADIPGVKYLGRDAFRNCTNLQTIVLDSVITIDDAAFQDCANLTSAVISEHCTMIGEGAFCNALKLREVYCYPVYPPFIKTDNYDTSYVFDNVPNDMCIYIPNGSFDYYIDEEFFIDQTFEDSTIQAKVNWWYEEYEDFLVEM